MQYIRCSLIYSATAYFCPIFKRVVCDNLYSVLDTMTRVRSDKPQFILHLFINWTRRSSPEYPSSVIHCINALPLVAYTLCLSGKFVRSHPKFYPAQYVKLIQYYLPCSLRLSWRRAWANTWLFLVIYCMLYEGWSCYPSISLTRFFFWSFRCCHSKSAVLCKVMIHWTFVCRLLLKVCSTHCCVLYGSIFCCFLTKLP